MDIPIPPTHVYPHPPMDYGAQMKSAIDQMFDGPAPKGKTKKAKGTKQDAETDAKKKAPVETRYEAYTLQRLTPTTGDAKTWSKVGKLKVPFDSAKVYRDAVAHKTRSGMDASKMYDSLLINQQGVIDRILQEKRRDEKDPNAVWTLFDVYKVKQDTPVGLFRTSRETLKLIVTIRCQDKSKSSYTDKPPGSTAHPAKFVGEVIDLSLPLKAAGKGGKGGADGTDDNGGGGDGKKGKKGKGNKKNLADDPDAVFEEIVPGQYNDPFYASNGQTLGDPNALHPDHHQAQGHHHDQRHNYGAAGQQYDYQNDGYGYNNNNQQAHYGNNYPQGHQGYQNQNIPPHAPMAPNPLENPFTPQVGVPEQYAHPIAEQAYNEYSPRQYSRSRSRNRSRHHSRHRSGPHLPPHFQTPSLSSGHDDDGWGDSQFSPPPTPDSFDDPRMHRRGPKRQVYVREGRTYYPGEGYMLVPFSSSKRDSHPLPILTKRRTQIEYDDYPSARGQRAIADHGAEVYEDAEFFRRGRGREGIDFVTSRRGRYEDGYRPSSGRRYSLY